MARYRPRLLDEGVLDEAGAAAIEQEAADRVEEAFTEALADDAPDATAAVTDVYADPAGSPA